MNTVRIIGGLWRRRLLRFPDCEGLRPTPDRVRETLFNWLGQTLDGESCLDLFAGSGALGLEAASRGAGRVLMVEKSPAAAAALRSNIRLLGAGRLVEVLCGDALQCLPSMARRFDLVFLDPPFRQGWIDRVAPHLPRVLNEDAALYIEAEYEIGHLGEWRTVRAHKAGEVYYHLLRREHGPARQSRKIESV